MQNGTENPNSTRVEAETETKMLKTIPAIPKIVAMTNPMPKLVEIFEFVPTISFEPT